MKVAVITASDSGAAGRREDKSGPLIREIVTGLGGQVVSYQLLPDERTQLEEAMKKIADEGLAELILTTGGTGFSKRDCMPEATEAVSERRVPGIPEAMRAYSMQFTGRAMLSRASAGIRRETLIVNLPGSPKAVRETLEYIFPHLQHGIDILTGAASDCARRDGEHQHRKPPLLAVCGVKNSGKTTCLERLVAELSQMGLRVAVIKHDGHEFEGDVPGTDSFRMYQAGAWGTAICSKGQLLIHKRREAQSQSLQQLALLTEEFADCDLILVEGMKALPIPKVEIIRAGVSMTPVSNPQGRMGFLTDLTTDREEFSRITGYELSCREKLYSLERTKDLAQWLRDIFSQGGETNGKNCCSLYEPPEGNSENQCT